MDLKNRILVALGLDKEITSLSVQEKLTDGTIVVSSSDVLEAGSDISILLEDGTTEFLVPGKYLTESNIGFSVVDAGIIDEIYDTEDVEDEVEDEMPTEEDVEEEVEEVEASTEATKPLPKKIKETKEYEFSKEEVILEITNVVSELLSEARKDIESIRAELSDMRGNNTTLEEENISLSNEVAKLSAEPATTPESLNKFSKDVVKEPTVSERKRMTTKERLRYNLSKINN
tara:strand:+ start:67 stop:759 length:693 start_codon:yes stop_codon:yes gene_type:complete